MTTKLSSGTIYFIGVGVGIFTGFALCCMLNKSTESDLETKAVRQGYINIQGTDYKLVPVDVRTILVEKEQSK